MGEIDETEDEFFMNKRELRVKRVKRTGIVIKSMKCLPARSNGWWENKQQDRSV